MRAKNAKEKLVNRDMVTAQLALKCWWKRKIVKESFYTRKSEFREHEFPSSGRKD